MLLSNGRFLAEIGRDTAIPTSVSQTLVSSPRPAGMGSRKLFPETGSGFWRGREKEREREFVWETEGSGKFELNPTTPPPPTPFLVSAAAEAEAFSFSISVSSNCSYFPLGKPPTLIKKEEKILRDIFLRENASAWGGNCFFVALHYFGGSSDESLPSRQPVKKSPTPCLHLSKLLSPLQYLGFNIVGKGHF